MNHSAPISKSVNRLVLTIGVIIVCWFGHIATAQTNGTNNNISNGVPKVKATTQNLIATDTAGKANKAVAIELLPRVGYKFITEYYDATRKQIKRVYEVNKLKPNQPDGQFYSLYPDGKLKDKGQYKAAKPDGNWVHYLQNGVLKSEGTYLQGIQNGAWRFYFEGGSKRSEGQLVNNVQQGDWKFYFENGAVKQQGAYANGKPCSQWTYFYENGLRKAQATYQGDSAYYREQYEGGTLKAVGLLLNGKSTGTWRYYHPLGRLKAEGQEVAGLKEGRWTYFHLNDSLESEGNYTGGLQTGNWNYYHPNGKLNSKGRLAAGQKQGQWQMFYETGELSGQGNFLDGDGPFMTYYPSGKVKTKGAQSNGLNDGDWYFYAEDGSLEGKSNYHRGKGEYVGFYPDGKKRIVGQLDNGERIGTWSLFDPNGNLVGYYKTFTQAEGPTLPTLRNLEPTKPKPVEVLKMANVKQVWRHYRKVVNEQQGIIIGANPFAFIFGSLPVSVEYHWKPRLGFEATGTWIRNQFMNDYSAPDINKDYNQGFSFSLRQKLYFEEEPLIGSFYWAQEIRFTQLWHNYASFNFLDTSATRTIQNYEGTQTRIDLSLLIGTRIFQEVSRKQDVSIDIFGGVGVGMRFVNLPTDKGIFEQVDRSAFPVTFRFGFMVGYLKR